MLEQANRESQEAVLDAQCIGKEVVHHVHFEAITHTVLQMLEETKRESQEAASGMRRIGQEVLQLLCVITHI